MGAQGLQNGAVGFLALGCRQHAFGQGDCADADGFADTDGTLFPIETGLCLPLQMRGKDGADVDLGDGSGGRDAGVLGLALQVGDDEILLAGERIGGVDGCTAAIGQHEAPTLAARFGDTVGPGKQQESARGGRIT
jgi:hypothetical protein